MAAVPVTADLVAPAVVVADLVAAVDSAVAVPVTAGLVVAVVPVAAVPVAADLVVAVAVDPVAAGSVAVGLVVAAVPVAAVPVAVGLVAAGHPPAAPARHFHPRSDPDFLPYLPDGIHEPHPTPAHMAETPSGKALHAPLT